MDVKMKIIMILLMMMNTMMILLSNDAENQPAVVSSFGRLHRLARVSERKESIRRIILSKSSALAYSTPLRFSERKRRNLRDFGGR